LLPPLDFAIWRTLVAFLEFLSHAAPFAAAQELLPASKVSPIRSLFIDAKSGKRKAIAIVWLLTITVLAIICVAFVYLSILWAKTPDWGYMVL
jgi:uncharacterized membrane protein